MPHGLALQGIYEPFFLDTTKKLFLLINLTFRQFSLNYFFRDFLFS